MKADNERASPLHQTSQDLWLRLLRRAVLFALLWWILVGGESASWWVGVPAVLSAAAVSVAILSPVRMVWYELLRFVPFFLVRSVLGATDVAWRAFHPRMPIDPHLVKYPIRLSPGLPSVFLANTVSLLPGTLSTALNSNCLHVHVLTRQKDILPELEKLERKVAAIFGICMPQVREE